jgi:hypothetical protein
MANEVQRNNNNNNQNDYVLLTDGRCIGCSRMAGVNSCSSLIVVVPTSQIYRRAASEWCEECLVDLGPRDEPKADSNIPWIYQNLAQEMNQRQIGRPTPYCIEFTFD